MIISALLIITLVLTCILILFRVLRGESFRDIRREIKELKAQDVPHYFLRSLKIVFSFKGPGYARKQREAQQEEQEHKADNDSTHTIFHSILQKRVGSFSDYSFFMRISAA